MENSKENTPITPESVLVAVKEMLAESSAKFYREMSESSAKFERELAASNAKFERELAESNAKFKRELAESSAKFEREQAESSAKFEREQAESSANFDRELAKSAAEFDRRTAEFDRRNAEFDSRNAEFDHRTTEFDIDMKELKISMADTDKKIKSLIEQVAGITKSNGDIAEDYFFNSFQREQQNFFGEKFDKIIRGKGQIVEDEYDVVMINGHTACIIEVKYKARKDDIPKALKKVNTFRINFPEHKNHKIYLALAAYSFNENLERECIRQGIAVIKQVGETVIINDKHLKAF